MVNRGNIWQYRQNKPTYIVRDIVELFNRITPVSPAMAEIIRERTYEILIKRGIFKWLAVRRDLIRLKNAWRAEITQRQMAVELNRRVIRAKLHTPQAYRLASQNQYHRGYLAAMTECREAVRVLCHSDRWQVQDNDREAARWLAEQEARHGFNELTAVTP